MREENLVIYREHERELVWAELADSAMRVVLPGVLALSKPNDTSLVFACQTLPNAVFHQGLSVKALSDKVSEFLAEQIEPGMTWRLHVYDMGTVEAGQCFQRVRLVRQAVQEWLNKKNRTLRGTLLLSGAPILAREKLIQVFIPDNKHAWISQAVVTPDMFWPLRWPGGYLSVPDRKELPSRAFKKLIEAELLFGVKINENEIVYDLGASPGGWTAIAAERGAKIFAVDRSPLEQKLMSNSAVTFIKGDAFKTFPDEKADWLLTDVAAFPEKTFELVKAWVARMACRKLCVTFKFTGNAQGKFLNEVSRFARVHFERFFFRRLINNKNEVTLAGSLK